QRKEQRGTGIRESRRRATPGGGRKRGRNLVKGKEGLLSALLFNLNGNLNFTGHHACMYIRTHLPTYLPSHPPTCGYLHRYVCTYCLLGLVVYNCGLRWSAAAERDGARRGQYPAPIVSYVPKSNPALGRHRRA